MNINLTPEQLAAVERVRRVADGESLYRVYHSYDEQEDFNRDMAVVSLLPLLSQPQPCGTCQTCGGSKVVVRRTAWGDGEMPCPDCRVEGGGKCSSG